MWIYEGLGLNIDKGEVLSLIGGGGKTTTLFTLGQELKKLNKKVLITTTTAIYNPEIGYDYYFLEDIEDFEPEEGSITIFGDRVEKGKLIGISLCKIEDIIKKKLFNFVLIEADGAKGKPIKAHAYYEPVIPKGTTKTIGIIGLDCLGRKIEEVVHRPELFIKITETQYWHTIDEETIVKYILNPESLFERAKGTKIILLNKAYNEKTILKGDRIRRTLLGYGFKNTVIVADVRRKKYY